MQNTTPQLISVGEYNKKVKGWTLSTRSRMARNAPSRSGTLKKSLTSRVKTYNGEAGKITYDFEDHGVYVHYGVGRGYIRVGDMVMPGRRLTEAEKGRMIKRGDSKRDVNKMKISYGGVSVRRKANDWFDVEIRTGLNELANIVQEYYGDKAMHALLKKMDKATISKKI